MKNKITLTTPADITSIVPNKYPSKIVLETGEENVFIPDENKFIVTKDFLSNAPSLFAFCVFTELDMSNFDFSEITTMEKWFFDVPVQKIAFPENVYCPLLTNMRRTFDTAKLEFLDMSNWHFGNAKVDLTRMCNNSWVEKFTLPKATISNFDFCCHYCGRLEEIDFNECKLELPDRLHRNNFESCFDLKTINCTKVKNTKDELKNIFSRVGKKRAIKLPD